MSTSKTKPSLGLNLDLSTNPFSILSGNYKSQITPTRERKAPKKTAEEIVAFQTLNLPGLCKTNKATIDLSKSRFNYRKTTDN